MNALKKIPFFLFMLPLFFCLHGSVENFGHIELNEVLLVGAGMLICIGLFFALIFFLVKNFVTASLITFFISVWYLFFGAIVDCIKSYGPLSFFSKYSVLLPLLLVLTVCWVIFLKKNKVISLKLIFYLNILLLIYCLVDGALLMNKQFTPTKKMADAVAFDTGKVTEKPNVYYLVFDGYAGYKSLQDSFGFANDSLYSFLKKKEFSILQGFSNYDLTLFSMSSILNMRYVDSDYDAAGITQHDLQLRATEIKHAAVFSIFNKMGYRLKNYSIFDIGQSHGVARHNAFLPVHSVLLTDKILHNRVIRTSRSLFVNKFAFPSRKKRQLFQHDTNNLFSQKMISKTAGEKDKNPQFSFAHFLMPHWPYYRDSTGAYNPFDVFAKNALDGNKTLYLSYLKYTNTVIKTLVTDITVNDPRAIIVIMSDHGFRNYQITKPVEPLYFDNICAIRIPGKKYPEQKLSSVNTFRYLFNCAYGQQIPYLPDSTVLLSNSAIDF